MLYLTIPRRGVNRLPVRDLAEASAYFDKVRTASGEGASTFPDGRVEDASLKVVGRISYNGRIWDGDLPIYP